MFAILHAILVIHLASVPGTTSKATTLIFDLATCSRRATDIVVVNEVGRIQEVWKGDMTPGDAICLGNLVDNRHWPLLDPQIDNHWSTEWYKQANHTRQIVFLCDDHSLFDRYESHINIDGLNAEHKCYWLPASESGTFASSIATVDRLGCVYTLQKIESTMTRFSRFGDEYEYEYRWLPTVSLELFREQVKDFCTQSRSNGNFLP